MYVLHTACACCLTSCPMKLREKPLISIQHSCLNDEHCFVIIIVMDMASVAQYTPTSQMSHVKPSVNSDA